MAKKGRNGGGRIGGSVSVGHRGSGGSMQPQRHYSLGESGGGGEVQGSGRVVVTGRNRKGYERDGYDDEDDRGRTESRKLPNVNGVSRYSKDSTSEKFEWEQLMVGSERSSRFDAHSGSGRSRNSVVDEHGGGRRSSRDTMVDERGGGRSSRDIMVDECGGGRIRDSRVYERRGDGFMDFRGDEDVFRGDMSAEIERRRYVTRLPDGVGRRVTSEFVDRRLMSKGGTGNERLHNVGHLQFEDKLTADRTIRGGYFVEEERHKVYSDNARCHRETSSSPYEFPGPILMDAHAKEDMLVGEKPVAVKTVKASHEGEGARFS